MKMMFAAAAAVIAAAPSFAVSPISYDMPNGETGSYTYWDDSYNGSGDKTTSGAALSGGLGDLTDGIIATQRWDVTPGLYVGWVSIAPTIKFNFTAGTSLSQVSLFFNNAGGYGGVYLPSSVDVDTGSGFQALDATVTIDGQVARYDYNFAPVSTNFLATRINHPLNSSYVMLSEVTFDGEANGAVPEPASWALMLVGFGGMGYAMRRSRKVAVSFS